MRRVKFRVAGSRTGMGTAGVLAGKAVPSTGRARVPGHRSHLSSGTGAPIMKRTVSVLLVVALATATLCGVGDSQEAQREGVAAPARPAGPTTSGRSARRSTRLHSPSRKAMPGPSSGSSPRMARPSNAEGGTIQGRTALESHYAARLADAPGDKLETAVETIAFLAPGVARVTGRTRETSSSGSAPRRCATRGSTSSATADGCSPAFARYRTNN